VILFNQQQMLKKVIRYQINGMKEEKQIEIIFEDVVLKKGKNREWLFRNQCH